MTTPRMCSLDKCPSSPSVSVGIPGKLRHMYVLWDALGAFVFPHAGAGFLFRSERKLFKEEKLIKRKVASPFSMQTDLVHLFFFTLGGWDWEIGFHFIYHCVRLSPAFLPSLTSVNFFGSCSCSVSSVVSDSMRPHGLQHARLPCPLPSPGACSDSCPLSQWCISTILSSVSLSPPAFYLSQHQGFFQWGSSLHQVAKSRGCLVPLHFLP